MHPAHINWVVNLVMFYKTPLISLQVNELLEANMKKNKLNFF